MRKLMAVLLLSLSLFGSAVYSAPFLDRRGCENFAQAAGLIQEYVNQGDTDVIPKLGSAERFARLPKEVKEQIDLILRLALKNKGDDPQAVYEGYTEFCIATQGDLAIMNSVLHKTLDDKEI